MKKSIIILTVVVCALAQEPTVAAPSQSAEQAFSYLTWVDPDAGGGGFARFGYDAASFNPVVTLLDHLSANHPHHDADNEMEDTLVGYWRNASGQTWAVRYSPGWSGDPRFEICDMSGKMIWSQEADRMCILASGVIYTASRTNHMFDVRRKWTLSADGVTQTPQPLLYVGLGGKLLKAVTLWSHKTDGQAVASLPAGYEIEVLLADTETGDLNYLARTAFGLVGWLRLTAADIGVEPSVVEGLFFSGD